MRRKAQLAVLFVVALTLVSTLWPATGHAQIRRARLTLVGDGGYFYGPFWEPYPWYPYGYPAAYDRENAVRVLVVPKLAQVYVDGYYAGIVDDFDGLFQGLRAPPDEHEITLYLEGYRTVRQELYLAPASTYKLRYTMQPVAPGEVTERRPVASPPANAPFPPQYPTGQRVPQGRGMPPGPPHPVKR